MGTSYRYAASEDLELLIRERLRFIRVDETGEQYEAICRNCRSFFAAGLAQDTCTAVLAEEEGRLVGIAMAFRYLSVPSSGNTEGKNAFITNVFVEPDCRRRGIASEMVRQIVAWAKKHGSFNIMLASTEMGRPVYEQLGFVQTPGAMIYKP